MLLPLRPPQRGWRNGGSTRNRWFAANSCVMCRSHAVFTAAATTAAGAAASRGTAPAASHRSGALLLLGCYPLNSRHSPWRATLRGSASQEFRGGGAGGLRSRGRGSSALSREFLSWAVRFVLRFLSSPGEAGPSAAAPRVDLPAARASCTRSRGSFRGRHLQKVEAVARRWQQG